MTDQQEVELKFLKRHFPYRIIFGVIDKDTGLFSSWARNTKAIMNKKAREGHTVYRLI